MTNSEKGMNMLKRLWVWLCKAEPQGLGTLLVGIAAIAALIQSSGLLDKILEIQKQARVIEEAVTELKGQSIQISNAISLLSAQMKELEAKKTVENSPDLQKANPSKEQIEDAIKSAIPFKPTPGVSSIYLPEDKLSSTVEMIYKAKTPRQRANILQNSLDYRPATGEPATMKTKDN